MFLFIQYDQDFYPGRRKRGKDYEDGMVNFLLDCLTSLIGSEVFEVNCFFLSVQYELPFYYPGMVSFLPLGLFCCSNDR